MELDHLSYSSISSYLTCAANWKFHYIDKVPAPTSPELVFGSAFHNTIESVLTPGNITPLVDLWQHHWNEQLEGEKTIDFGADTPEYFCNEGIRILSNPEIAQSILSIVPGLDEAGVKIERKVELRVPGVPIPIVGYIDIITADGVPGDFKTSARAWTNDKALNETQPLFYLAALNQAGVKTLDWKFRHFVFVKTKTPQFQMIEHIHEPKQLMWLFKMIANVWRGIEADIFPENPTGWKCSPTYCDYWSMCRGK